MVKPSLRSRIPGVLCIALSLAVPACEPEPADSNNSEKSKDEDEDDDSKNSEDDKSEDKDDDKSEDDTSEEDSESSEDESPTDDDDSSSSDEDDDESPTDEDESSSTDEDDSTSDEDDDTDPSDDDSSDEDDSSTEDPDPCADISPSGSGKAKGDVPPDFELNDQNGDTFKLYDHCEEVVQLVGSAMWCGPCKQERATLQAMHDKYKDQGFITVTALFENNSSQPPTQADLQAWTQYGSGTLTHPVIADPNDKLWTSSVFSGNNYVPVIALLGKNVQIAVPQQNQVVSTSAIEAELAK